MRVRLATPWIMTEESACRKWRATKYGAPDDVGDSEHATVVEYGPTVS
jgi:hypothetical protein